MGAVIKSGEGGKGHVCPRQCLWGDWEDRDQGATEVGGDEVTAVRQGPGQHGSSVTTSGSFSHGKRKLLVGVSLESPIITL